MKNSTLTNIMSKNVVSITSQMSYTEACRLFTSLGVHHLPVVDQNKNLIGIFSTTDALFAVSNKLIQHEVKSEEDINKILKIEELMTGDNIHTLDVEDNVDKAIYMFQEHNIHSIPVLDEGKLEGIITSTDMMAAFRDSINV